MYSGNVYGNCNPSGNFPDSRNFNFDSQGYFNLPLEYRIRDTVPFYRTSAYLGMFSLSNLGLPKMIYGGMSLIEKYISGNAVRMQVGLEYSINSHTYSTRIGYEEGHPASETVHNPQIFLSPNRPEAQFIDNLTPQLKKKIAQIFRLTTGFEMPEDIAISILPAHELERQHSKVSKNWNNDIQGFALNRKNMKGVSSIFVRHNPLDMLIMTIGHEIGHCLSIPKEDILLEEEKAFAFELAWMKTIHRHDFFGLKGSMRMSLLNPSENGVHDVALQSVRERLGDKEPIEVFREISGY
jgi:hypothetical protein